MRSPLPLTALCSCLALSLAATGTAEAKKAKKPKRLQQATYTVIARATMKEDWRFLERAELKCHDLTACTVETEGSGTATIQLKAKPTTWLVMRGFGGRPPSLNVGTGEGAQMTGSYLRSGTLETTHGGSWAEANPPEKASTSGCGDRRITVDMNLAFVGRNQLAPSAFVDDAREDCPDGPSSGMHWDQGDGPSLMDVVTQAAQSKFLSAKQFTVSGTRTWTAKVDPPSGSYSMRSGSKTVTWSWSVTFQMNKKGRR